MPSPDRYICVIKMLRKFKTLWKIRANIFSTHSSDSGHASFLSFHPATYPSTSSTSFPTTSPTSYPPSQQASSQDFSASQQSQTAATIFLTPNVYQLQQQTSQEDEILDVIAEWQESWSWNITYMELRKPSAWCLPLVFKPEHSEGINMVLKHLPYWRKAPAPPLLPRKKNYCITTCVIIKLCNHTVSHKILYLRFRQVIRDTQKDTTALFVNRKYKIHVHLIIFKNSKWREACISQKVGW